MSIVALLVPLGVSLIAMVVKVAILGRWVAQAMAADFFYALAITLLPGFIHA